MDFVTFQTAGEAFYFSKNIPAFTTWVGITDQLVEGKYTNYYDTSRDVSSLLNWVAGEPNNGGGSDEDCLWVNTVVGAYNDAPCSSIIKAGCMSKFISQFYCLENPNKFSRNFI